MRSRSPPTRTPLSPAALGRVLAAESAPMPIRLPSPSRSAMAMPSALRTAPSRMSNFAVVAEIAAGAVPTRAIGPGECARIFTGAPLPDGADAVVMQEDTRSLGDRVGINDSKVKPNQWVFARGTEMRAGEVVLPAGTVINPAALGVLASLGQTHASLFPEPRVGILSTGNELVEPAMPLLPGQIRNSNGPMLAAQVIACWRQS